MIIVVEVNSHRMLKNNEWDLEALHLSKDAVKKESVPRSQQVKLREKFMQLYQACGWVR